MAEFRILYVDEEAEERRRFQFYIRRNDGESKFEVVALEPNENLEDFVEEIMNGNYDAIITDHKLGDAMPEILYDGIDLVKMISDRRLDFPCFILTSWDDEAVKNGDDVNIVYIKGLMNGEEGHKATFIDKIENQIKHHRNKINEYELEYQELLNKDSLNSFEDEKLTELDTIIEKMTNKHSSIPKSLKTRENLDELHKMINNTDNLINKLKDL